MYMKNEILIDVWRNRDEFAKRHNYDLDKMVETLQKMECSAKNPLVDRRKKTPKKKQPRTPRSRGR
jgi:hypothetical protein